MLTWAAVVLIIGYYTLHCEFVDGRWVSKETGSGYIPFTSFRNKILLGNVELQCLWMSLDVDAGHAFAKLSKLLHGLQLRFADTFLASSSWCLRQMRCFYVSSQWMLQRNLTGQWMRSRCYGQMLSSSWTPERKFMVHLQFSWLRGAHGISFANYYKREHKVALPKNSRDGFRAACANAPFCGGLISIILSSPKTGGSEFQKFKKRKRRLVSRMWPGSWGDTSTIL